MAYLDNIPQAMRERQQWMLTDRNKAPLAWDWGEERTYAGSKNRPDQFLSYETARQLAEQEGLLIGFVPLSDDPFTIIDLDFKENKVYDAEADDVKKSLLDGAYRTSYIETSLSGKGYHIIVRGKLAHDFNAASVGIECYGNKGFVVITGRMPEGCEPIEPTDQQAVLEWLADKYRRAYEEAAVGDASKYDPDLVRNPSAADVALDDALIANMSTWHNAANLERYFYGQDLRPNGGGGSEGDLALMQAFLKFTKSERKPEAAMRMFLKTPRAKVRQPYKEATSDWNQYLSRTLRAAEIAVARDEKRAKDFDFSAGTHEMMRQYQAQIEASRAPESLQAPEQQPSTASAPVNSPTAPGQAPAQFKGFSWLTKRDLEKAPPLEWAVKGLFPMGGVGAIYGESGAGKSFVGIDLIAAVAEGSKWFGMRTKKLPVSVFALEGEGGLKGRVKAWELQNKREYPESVLFWDSARNGSFALRDADARSDENKTRLVQLCADLNASGRRGGVVVIDTLNQASDGADENSSRDMGELLKAMKLIQRETNSLVLIVHHATKSKENQSMRGHSSLYGAMDGIMEVIREVWTEGEQPKIIEGRRGWIAKKVKDGRDGYTKLFDMKEHQVGFDEDGPIMSIAIEPVAEFIVDEQTGEINEVANSGTLKAPRGGGNAGGGSSAVGNGGKRSKSGGAQRAGSSEAPAVTRPNRDKPTYSEAERAGAQEAENAPRSAKQADEQRQQREGKGNQSLVLAAIVAEGTESKNIGRMGAPEGVACAPSSAVIERAVRDANRPDPAQHRRDLRKVIVGMRESGKLAGKIDEGGKEWIWPS